MRTAAIADNGATLVVKNSELSVRNSPLPADYIPTVNLDTMEDAPWMLGHRRRRPRHQPARQQLVAAYVNSSITSESWGVLSTDSGTDCTLVAVNSVVTNTGDSGYGTYAIGNATEYLLGTEFNVGSYATIFTGGNATYGDSDPATVAALNASLGLGLTDAELRAIPPRPTVVNSRQWGFMWHARRQQPGDHRRHGRQLAARDVPQQGPADRASPSTAARAPGSTPATASSSRSSTTTTRAR